MQQLTTFLPKYYIHNFVTVYHKNTRDVTLCPAGNSRVILTGPTNILFQIYFSLRCKMSIA